MRGTASRPVLLLLIGRTLGSAASFVVPVVLARIFDQAEFGAYKQVFLVYFTFYGIAQVGMAESLFYFVPLAGRDAGRCVVNSILVLAGAGVACVGLLSVFQARISAWLGNPAMGGLLPLVGGFLLLMLISSVLEIVLTSRNRYLGASVAYAGSDLVRAFLFVVPAVLFGRLEALLLGALAFGLIRCCAALGCVRAEFGADLRWDPVVLRRQMSYALPFGLAGLVGIVESNLHQYAVSHLFDAATFAVYSVGCLQVPLVDLVAGSACNVMMVRMADELRDGGGRSIERIWVETTRKLALVFFPLVGLLLVSAREMVLIFFTDRYAASVPIFMVWSLTIALAAFQVDGVLRVHADTRFLLGLYLTKLVLIASSIGWLISRLRLPGAALATILALALAKALALLRIKIRLGIPVSRLLPWRDLLRAAAAATLAGAMLLAVRPHLALPALPLLFGSAALYLLAYGILWLALGLGGEPRRLMLGRAVAGTAAGPAAERGIERG